MQNDPIFRAHPELARGDVRRIDNLPLAQIWFMHNNPRCACSCCGGEGFHAVAETISLGPVTVTRIVARDCTHCEGSGTTEYVCVN